MQKDEYTIEKFGDLFLGKEILKSSIFETCGAQKALKGFYAAQSQGRGPTTSVGTDRPWVSAFEPGTSSAGQASYRFGEGDH